MFQNLKKIILLAILLPMVALSSDYSEKKRYPEAMNSCIAGTWIFGNFATMAFTGPFSPYFWGVPFVSGCGILYLEHHPELVDSVDDKVREYLGKLKRAVKKCKETSDRNLEENAIEEIDP